MRQEIIITPTTTTLSDVDVCVLSCVEYPNGVCVPVADVGNLVAKVLGDRKNANK